MITGGEPLLFPEKLANLAESIKTVQKLAYGNKGKLFLYICGMSVPPVMMAHVASRIWKYWLSKL